MINSSIAIVIPVYNVKKFLNETLLSVKNQLSQPDEVVIIDDGSTDGSSKLLENFNKLRHWKIIRTPNNGLGLTRNYGRSIAQSEYIYFLDADDIIKNNLILKIREIINNYNKPDMILFSGETFNNDYSNNIKQNLLFTISGQFFQNDNLITKLVNRKETLPQVGRYVTKTKLWFENNLKFSKGVAEDDELFFPLIALSKNIFVTTDILYKYRTGRIGSISSQKIKSDHANDYLNRILFNIEFINSKKKLIKKDISAWKSQLSKKVLNYVSVCLKTKNSINMKIIPTVFFQTKSFIFLIKLGWRFIRFYISVIFKFLK